MIKEWLMKRQEEENTKKFHKGFGWAMSTYFLDKAPLDEIRVCIYNDDDDYFDKGAISACDIIQENCQRKE